MAVASASALSSSSANSRPVPGQRTHDPRAGRAADRPAGGLLLPAPMQVGTRRQGPFECAFIDTHNAPSSASYSERTSTLLILPSFLNSRSAAASARRRARRGSGWLSISPRSGRNLDEVCGVAHLSPHTCFGKACPADVAATIPAPCSNLRRDSYPADIQPGSSFPLHMPS